MNDDNDSKPPKPTEKSPFPWKEGGEQKEPVEMPATQKKPKTAKKKTAKKKTVPPRVNIAVGVDVQAMVHRLSIALSMQTGLRETVNSTVRAGMEALARELKRKDIDLPPLPK